MASCTYNPFQTAPALRYSATLLLLGSIGSAQAAFSDTLFPYIGMTYAHDDNLLRLPDNSTFAGPRGDDIRQLDYGLRFERPVGRQVFTGDFKFSRVNYSHFSELNYTGKDFRAAWNWQLGNHLEGHVGGQHIESLTSFSDYHTSERNLRTQRKEYVDAIWRFHPSWRLRGGFTRQEFNYDLLQQRVNDRTEDASEAGFDYISPSGSYFGLIARAISGNYPNSRSVSGLTLNEDYRQREIKANIDWRLSGTSRLQVLAGHARRTHSFFTERDSSGLNGRGIYTWTPQGRISLTGTVWREFMAMESLYSGSSLNKGASLGAGWDLGAKLRLDGQFKRERRAFEPVTTLSVPFDYSDSTRTVSAGVSYAPWQSVMASLSAYRETRNGNAGFINGGNYHTKGVSLSINAQF